jgi:D-apionolactonase
MTRPSFDPVKLVGLDTPAPVRRDLRAGPLTLQYDDGALRYLRVGGVEVLRRIYIAVRDQNWGTVPVTIKITAEDIRDDQFQIDYSARAERGGIDFRWRSSIIGTREGRILFTFDGTAKSDFLRNRIGFCVLHAADCAGARCRIRTSDDQWREEHFPREIAATNPFVDLTGIAHEAANGVWTNVEFAGDHFETEDQRNWADASFKTFCTPLSLPFPVEIQRGTRIQQSVRVGIEGEINVRSVEPSPGRVELRLATAPPCALPRIGIALAPGVEHDATVVSRLKQLNLAHLRVELKPDQSPDADLRRAAEIARDVGCELEVALFLSDPVDSQLAAISKTLEDIPSAVARWIVLHVAEKAASNDRWVKRARQTLAAQSPGAQFGTGTDLFFMELNRSRPKVDGLDFICFSSNPQVHAFDASSTMETLSMHQTLVENATRLAGGLPVVVSPLTLRMRSNPVATGPEREDPLQLPGSVDRRQPSLFAAAWTLGAIKYLAEGGAASVTLFETVGWRGLMESADGSPRPDLFPSVGGGVFPLYHVLADVGEFAGGEVLPIASTAPLAVIGLHLRRAGREALLIANLTESQQTVSVPTVPTHVARVRRLGINELIGAVQEPTGYRNGGGAPVPCRELLLGAFELVRLDWSP